jgi:hypothetical protein
MTVLGGLVLFACWKWFKFANRPPANDPRHAERERQALIASINKTLAQTGQNLPPSSGVVIKSAVLRDRDGKRYLTGTVHNQSAVSYSLLHLVFNTYDKRHNRAGEVEGDVVELKSGQEAPFEIGPANANARTCALESMRVEK